MTETREEANVERVRAYLRAIEEEAPEETLRAFFTEDVEQIEFPNRLVPSGATRDLAALLAGNVKGRAVVEQQRYEIASVVARGDVVAVELVWTATLRVPIGALAAGDTMRARFAVFVELVDGRIRRQRNYDCFDPF